MYQPQVIALSGPSGAGKNTILKKVLGGWPELNCEMTISATTRAPREGEIDTLNYFFLTRPHFAYKLKHGWFIERAKYGRNYYGTFAYSVDDILARGKSVIIELDTRGAFQIMRKRPNAISIFVSPPAPENPILRDRLIKRDCKDGNTTEEIERRLKIAERELSERHRFNFNVVNDDADRTASEVAQYLKQQLLLKAA